MALFFNASTERVTYTAPLMGDPCTLLVWLKPDTVSASFRQVAGQICNTPTGQWRWASSHDVGAGSIRIFIAADTTSMDYIASDGTLVVDVWNYLGIVVDTAAGDLERVQIYRGDLASAAVEAGYQTRTEPGGGLGTTDSDLEVGGDGDGDGFGFEGDIAMVSVWPGTALTLEQVVGHQWARYE